ncbi:MULTISPECIES: DNA-protecting protein DprA [unclassified Brenneria]|uniref:DNA-protecting protein DprA n=1 Tax=unclassified Brenneria TaxID=2634434 RepID=UPI0015575AAE|nr:MULTISPECIES: DNA-protecting protein DprA [unclassified Brenneria]MBJ7224140.1 DNA-protecting protein DprA [Brenneria sp. L3-3C-1]MEE3645386.1 DNA-protecting protein DprA [Brenneria sp. L3_3C_1]MEE3653094.1 DNA-protecting protein DprA [Brenneria sp. HEZEL_4_2_4]NPD03047.1 DNA-protecting protein DprA [Brenneria sp. hezel4-2-4]
MLSTEIWLRLTGVKHLGAKRAGVIARELIALGDHNRRDLIHLGMTDVQAEQFQRFDPRRVEDTLRWLSQPDHHMVTCSDKRYPFLLGNISAFPLLLFVAGDPTLLASPQIAIVGSRNNSAYGDQWGYFFAQELAVNNLTITSGLAIGIDGIAHRATLDVDGKTIAILGSGLENIYPMRHRKLAARILDQGGALVSEFPLATPPLAVNFPRRNRIISGLSLGVLVVEASVRSGSLVTARYALDQGRDVFALPGAIGNPMTEGTHWLIQQGAYLVTHPKNIVEQLRSGLHWICADNDQTISAVEEDVELPFADVLANVGDEVTPVDVVAERAGQPVPEIVSKLLELELAGWIAAVPGGYVRLRRAGHVRRTHVLV